MAMVSELMAVDGCPFRRIGQARACRTRRPHRAGRARRADPRGMRLMGTFPTPCGHTRRTDFAAAAAAASHLPPSTAPIIVAPLLPPPLLLRSVPPSIAS
ncbi:hypothetical protein K525DRAFT_275478 [Schizophyllum commune Loenen D]|nr:hypothetical protein K525DRAFT_275478 [Schizophyllum commune Loenen D]